MMPLRHQLGGLRRRLADARYWARLRRVESGSPEYRSYLEAQLRRTLVKRGTDPGVGARILIEQVAVPGASVLCVGCRNTVELDEFMRRGAADVVGIDLFSQRDDIVVMDMHKMTFEDASFDVVYSCHSLEHSYDPALVAHEIERVARVGGIVAVEVPLRVHANDADRVVFQRLDDVRALFEHVGDVLLAEEVPARSEANPHGSDVARLVFRLR